MKSFSARFPARCLVVAIQMLMTGMPVCWAGQVTLGVPVNVTVIPSCVIASPQTTSMDQSALIGTTGSVLNCGAGQSAAVFLSVQPISRLISASSSTATGMPPLQEVSGSSSSFAVASQAIQENCTASLQDTYSLKSCTFYGLPRIS